MRSANVGGVCLSEKPSCKIRFAKVGCRQDWQPKKKANSSFLALGPKKEEKSCQHGYEEDRAIPVQHPNRHTHANVEEEELERVLLREERETKAKGDP